MTPTAHPSTLDPPAASHPKLLERDFSISFGSLNWAFATRDSRDSGGMLKRQVLILPTPPKKGLKVILFLHWLIWSQKKTGNFFSDPWKMQGRQIINWCLEKARCVSFSQVSWVFFVESMASSIWKVWTFVKGTQFLRNREYGRKGIKRRICVKYDKKRQPQLQYLYTLYVSI